MEMASDSVTSKMVLMIASTAISDQIGIKESEKWWKKLTKYKKEGLVLVMIKIKHN